VSVEKFFHRVVIELEKAGIPYMVTGSLASSAHGRIRASEDFDIIIAPSPAQLRAFVAAFPGDQYYADEEDALESFKHTLQFNIIDFATTWKADLIFKKDREFSRVEFSRRKPHVIGGVRVHLATPEDILIAKLEWAKMGESERQIEDAVGVIERQGSNLDRSYVEHWIEELDLRKQWEMALARAEQR
jgi:hypothetical protein